MNDKLEYIRHLKKEKNAVILAHYYQNSEIQDIADYLGDSLALAQQAKNTNADIILFAGVKFMAETAKILNPERIVLLPDLEAGCSLADNTPADKFKEWKEAYPDSITITYINSSTEVKAMSDIICTSSNAVKIVNSIPKDKKILFAPDKYLGRYVMKKTGRQMVLWDATCQVHTVFSEIGLLELTKNHPDAEILAHPECPDNLLNYADFIGSTTAIIKQALNSPKEEFIILTEPGIIHQLELKAPSKKYYTVPNLEGCSCNECPYMKLITLDKIIYSLKNLEPRIEIEEELRLKALKPIEKMLELS